MNVNESTNQNVINQQLTIIIVVVVLVLVILLAGYIALEILVFRKMRAKKKLGLEKAKFENLSNLLLNEDNQYLSRLESIQNSNLLYAEVYQEYLNKYLETKEGLETEVSEIITDLETALENKDLKAFKEIYKSKQNDLNYFETTIKSIHSDLQELIRPEEDCRKDSLMLKEKYREIKGMYEENIDILSTVSDRFDVFFRNVDKKFNEFEELVDTANYEEAKLLLPVLAKVFTQIKVILEHLPTYLNEVNDIIPKQMGALKNKYDTLVEGGLPLSHLKVENELEYIKNVLIDLREQYKDLKIEGSQEKIERLHLVLANLDNSIDNEEKARIEFSRISDDIIFSYLTLNDNVTKLNNNLSSYQKVYIVDEEHMEALKNLNAETDTLSKFKRRLDYFFNGQNRSYFTDLLNKVNDLKKGVDATNVLYNNLKSYLDSLVVDVKKSYDLINSRYLRLKKSEASLREFNNEELTLHYEEAFKKSYDYLDEISYNLLEVKPIDVNRVNELTKEMEELTSSITKEIADLGSFRVLASENIVFLNRDRAKFSDISSLMNQAESLFFKGSYESAYNMSETIMEKMKEKSKVAK